MYKPPHDFQESSRFYVDGLNINLILSRATSDLDLMMREKSMDMNMNLMTERDDINHALYARDIHNLEQLFPAGLCNSGKQFIRHLTTLVLDGRLYDRWSDDTVLPLINLHLASYPTEETGGYTPMQHHYWCK